MIAKVIVAVILLVLACSVHVQAIPKNSSIETLLRKYKQMVNKQNNGFEIQDAKAAFKYQEMKRLENTISKLEKQLSDLKEAHQSMSDEVTFDIQNSATTAKYESLKQQISQLTQYLKQLEQETSGFMMQGHEATQKYNEVKRVRKEIARLQSLLGFATLADEVTFDIQNGETAQKYAAQAALLKKLALADEVTFDIQNSATTKKYQYKVQVMKEELARLTPYLNQLEQETSGFMMQGPEATEKYNELQRVRKQVADIKAFLGDTTLADEVTFEIQNGETAQKYAAQAALLKKLALADEITFDIQNSATTEKYDELKKFHKLLKQELMKIDEETSGLMMQGSDATAKYEKGNSLKSSIAKIEKMLGL